MRLRTALLVAGGALVMLAASFSVQVQTALADDETEESIQAIWDIKDDAWEHIDWIVSDAGAGLTDADTESEVAAVLDWAKSDIWETNGWAQAAMWWVAANAHWRPPVASAYEDASAALANHTDNSIGIVEDRAGIRLNEIRDHVLAKLDSKLNHGLGKLDTILSNYQAALAAAETAAEAAAARDEALQDVEVRRTKTANKLDQQLARYPSHPDVQAAHDAATGAWHGAVDAAAATVNSMHSTWQPPGSTATTVPPSTTTTVPPTTTTTAPPTTTTTAPTTTTTVPTTTTTTAVTTTTTTTSAPTSTTTLPAPAPTTTTTTLPAAALLPPTDPPATEVAFMPKVPAPVVLAAVTEEFAVAETDEEMATVGLVRRVVDSQLPAGVATVAAGPLVVLGLIVDAIRAAGGLLVVPWILLGIYMAGLLRGWRGFTELT